MLDGIIISDASPLIALADIEELDLLRKLYQKILITDVVKNEVHAELPSWIEVTTEYDQKQFQVLTLELDPGEASAIALALNHPNTRIIIGVLFFLITLYMHFALLSEVREFASFNADAKRMLYTGFLIFFPGLIMSVLMLNKYTSLSTEKLPAIGAEN